ncbi:MAG: acyl-CoA dehydrogenase family protein [Janthinobacterium lividum]
MDFDLPPNAVEMQQATRRVVDELLKLEADFHRTGQVPALAAQRFKELGLFGIGVPEAYGGLALDSISSIAVQIELSRLPPQFWPLLRSALGPSIKTLVNIGTDAQKQTWLPQIARGDCAVGIAMTEPHAGSDVSGIKTHAELVDGHYVLNGTKMFISNANKVDLFTVFAYTDRTKGTRGGISAFLVPRGTAGMSVSAAIPTMGWVQDGVFEMSFEDCRLPLDSLLGEEGKGFTYFYKCLNEGRLSVGAQALGAASIALEHSVEYAKQRKAFGHPIADFQAVQHLLADMEVDVHLSRLMLMEAVWQFENGRATGRTCSRVKLFCAEAAGRVADKGVQVHGGTGYCRGMIVERVYRDVRVLRIYDGTSEIHRNIIAKELLR